MIGALKLASVGFAGIPAHEIKINPRPKIQVIINVLFIIKPPSVRRDQFSLQNDQCKIINANCSFFILYFAMFSLCEPSLSSFVMLDIAKTLSLTDVREA